MMIHDNVCEPCMPSERSQQIKVPYFARVMTDDYEYDLFLLLEFPRLFADAASCLARRISCRSHTAGEGRIIWICGAVILWRITWWVLGCSTSATREVCNQILVDSQAMHIYILYVPNMLERMFQTPNTEGRCSFPHKVALTSRVLQTSTSWQHASMCLP